MRECNLKTLTDTCSCNTFYPLCFRSFRYMVVSGAPEKEINHAEKVCDMALDMIQAITDLKDPSTGR